MLGLGSRLPNDAYRKGASILIKFRVVILAGQLRSSNEFNNWLNQLRNPHIEYPPTVEWLSQLEILNEKHFTKENTTWINTSIVASGNAERYKFIKEKN